MPRWGTQISITIKSCTVCTCVCKSKWVLQWRGDVHYCTETKCVKTAPIWSLAKLTWITHFPSWVIELHSLWLALWLLPTLISMPLLSFSVLHQSFSEITFPTLYFLRPHCHVSYGSSKFNLQHLGHPSLDLRPAPLTFDVPSSREGFGAPLIHFQGWKIKHKR